MDAKPDARHLPAMPPAKPSAPPAAPPAAATPKAPKPPLKSRRRVAARPRALPPAERARVAEIFARFEVHADAPRTELDYASPFTLVVAVALSAQATDRQVNIATRRLFAAAATPAAMLALGLDGVTGHIKSIGLFRNKARNVMALSQLLIDRHGGEVPLDREALQALPGVGRKTASVVLNELQIEPAIAVDTHVFRVSQRLKLSKSATPDKVEADLMARVPAPYLTRAHHWLILHGRYVCVARRPKCETCLIADLCPSRALFAAAAP